MHTFKLFVSNIVVPFTDLMSRVDVHTDSEVNEALFIIKAMYSDCDERERAAVDKIIAALIEYRNS